MIVSLPSASVIAADGVFYRSSVGVYDLNKPEFVSSYYEQALGFQNEQILGIVLSIFCFLFLCASIAEEKTYH